MKFEVDRFRKNWPAIQKKTTDQRTWNLYMEGQCEEMLERPMFWTVLKTPAEQRDWDSWKQEKEAALKQVEKKREDIIKKYRQLTARMDQIVEEAGTHFDEEGNMLHDKNGFVPEKALFVDAFGQQIDGEFLDKLREIQRKEKPICIAWDGMSLVDDVGGVGGFCEFLETINGDNLEEKKSYKAWAKSLGWTGRMPKPENML